MAYSRIDKIEDIKALVQQGMRVMDAGYRVGWKYETLRGHLNKYKEAKLLAELNREKEVDTNLGISVR